MKKVKNAKAEFSEDPKGLKLEYDDISPFTGNKCVLIEADENTGMESRICMESGMTTTDRFTVGSRACEQYEKFVPELYKDTKFIDQTLNQVWYLSTMRTHVACLYAQGTTKDDYDWRLAMVKMLDEEERKKYPLENDPKQYHTHIVDVDNAERFERNEFNIAIDKFYTLIGTKWNDNQNETK